jgi:uncharacterized membrane protein
VIELTGPILTREARELLVHLRRVPGVVAVNDALERHDSPAGIPALQGDRPMPRHGLFRTRWAPAFRWSVGGTGFALVAAGLKRGGPIGAAAAIFGAAALIRAATNADFATLVGAGPSRRGIDVTKTTTVHAPVHDVFAFFTAFENFPKFMRHVREVKRLDGGRWHWKVQGPAGLAFEWDGVVTDHAEFERVSWTSTEGATIHNRGDARFEALHDGSTRLTIHLVYEPPLGAVGHAFAKLFAADPKRELDEDLLRFKSLLEKGRATGRNGVFTRSDWKTEKPS